MDWEPFTQYFSLPRLHPDEFVGVYAAAADPPALHGLSDMDWTAVHHAYGPAVDVPPLLRALVSGVPVYRWSAREQLFQTIYHQCTVYEATAAVVPVLYRAMAADGVPDTGLVAEVIAGVADGYGPAAVREAVACGLDTMRPYLQHPEEVVRRSVIVAVGICPGAAARWLPDLRAALRDEPNEYARELLAEVVGRHGGGVPTRSQGG